MHVCQSVLKKRYKSPNLAMYVHRRNEVVATDTLWCDILLQSLEVKLVLKYLFGTNFLVTDVDGIKTGKQFVNTIEDNIRRRGAPTKLISDCA
jgi:hypothetical protein